MHVELALRRCEAVHKSGCRWYAEDVAREVEPGHGDRIVHVEIVVGADCRDRDRDRLGLDDARLARWFK